MFNRVQVFIIYSLSLLLLVNCKDVGKTNQYVTEQHKDANGYAYETVSDDPTGLRLYTLENGLKVYLSRNQDEPKIQTYIAVRAGSNYDPIESTGLAHYLEHMLFKGTDKIGTKNWEEEKVYLDSAHGSFIWRIFSSGAFRGVMCHRSSPT